MAVNRDLDDLEFEVVVLRVHQGVTADIAYADDGNVEQGVPIEELSEMLGEKRGTWTDVHEMRYQEGLALLAVVDSEIVATPLVGMASAADDMHWEQGRFVADDGTIIISTGAAATALVPPGKSSDPEESGLAACGAGLRGIRCIRKHRRETDGLAMMAPVAA